jgi:hypothetical protein
MHITTTTMAVKTVVPVKVLIATFVMVALVTTESDSQAIIRSTTISTAAGIT